MVLRGASCHRLTPPKVPFVFLLLNPGQRSVSSALTTPIQCDVMRAPLQARKSHPFGMAAKLMARHWRWKAPPASARAGWHLRKAPADTRTSPAAAADRPETDSRRVQSSRGIVGFAQTAGQSPAFFVGSAGDKRWRPCMTRGSQTTAPQRRSPIKKPPLRTVTGRIKTGH
jgi:hypothetical protein